MSPPPAGSSPRGLLLVDKPEGITSFAVVAEARRRYRVRQVGHGGTLDPLATGLLPVLVGEATKLVPFLMGLDKRYQATVRFGAATDTYDREGKVTAVAAEEAVRALTQAGIELALARFLGRVRQRPPIFSAIKREGRPLYELARRDGADQVVEAEERDVVIQAIVLGRVALPDVDLTIDCGKGTYIRSIAHDLGRALGVPAHLAALRRTRIGPFDVAEAVALRPEEPGSRAVAPPLRTLEEAVAHLPAVSLDGEGERKLRLGQQAVLHGLPAPAGSGPVRVLGPGGRLVAIAELTAAPADGAGEGSGEGIEPIPRLSLGRVINP